MSIIPQSKFGDCSQCASTSVNVVKRGKDLWCFSCNSKDKAKTQTARANQRNAIRMVVSGQQPTTDVRENNKALEKFFADAAIEIDSQPKCWECGARIFRPFYRAATAHIFPKKIFPSIAIHPLNYLILGAGCGCHNKTHRLDTFTKMGVWKEAVDRFRIFEPLITEKHKYLNEFRDYANATSTRPDIPEFR